MLINLESLHELLATAALDMKECCEALATLRVPNGHLIQLLKVAARLETAASLMEPSEPAAAPTTGFVMPQLPQAPGFDADKSGEGYDWGGDSLAEPINGTGVRFKRRTMNDAVSYEDEDLDEQLAALADE